MAPSSNSHAPQKRGLQLLHRIIMHLLLNLESASRKNLLFLAALVVKSLQQYRQRVLFNFPTDAFAFDRLDLRRRGIRHLCAALALLHPLSLLIIYFRQFQQSPRFWESSLHLRDDSLYLRDHSYQTLPTRLTIDTSSTISCCLARCRSSTSNTPD